MLILFDSQGNRITDYGTNSVYPEGIPYEPKPGELVYRIHDDDSIVHDIMRAGSIEATIQNGEVSRIRIYKRILVSSDRSQILADGIDTATITATVDDPNSTEVIELYNGETLVDSEPAVNGSAVFLITMTTPGTLTLTVKSTTKYGQRDITIEGV
jgi:hypothetical protein